MSATAAPTVETARTRTTECHVGGTTNGPSSNTSSLTNRKELANARWAILRDALLKKVTDPSSRHHQHSIRRFPGFNFLKKQENDGSNEGGCRAIELLLKEYRWNSSQSLEWNLDRLQIAVLALAACFPKGKCLDVVVAFAKIASSSLNETCGAPVSTQEWFDTLKTRLCESVCLWNVKEEETNGNHTEVSHVRLITTTLLVQESSNSTKYTAFRYDLDDSTDCIDDLGPATDSTPEPRRKHSCTLWTREPRETKLSLDDLVSHRNTGIDNTGNICVWDSERTLAYLLYHHLRDFAALSLNMDSSEEYNILELGTGMAGLAAIALGLRLVMEHKSKDQCSRRSFNVLLTDGNAAGVKNNSVNQYLTNLHSTAQPEHPYQSLIVSCELLLWETDWQESSPSIVNSCSQDVIVVSDCTHFQNFHAALAITTLRSLRVGGSAVFCQPSRGTSLDNFVALITVTNCSQSNGPEHDEIRVTIDDPLVSCTWWSHSLLEEKHHQALQEHHEIYNESLHLPKILIVTKLRDLAETDRQNMMEHQHSRQTS